MTTFLAVVIAALLTFIYGIARMWNRCPYCKQKYINGRECQCSIRFMPKYHADAQQSLRRGGEPEPYCYEPSWFKSPRILHTNPDLDPKAVAIPPPSNPDE